MTTENLHDINSATDKERPDKKLRSRGAGVRTVYDAIRRDIFDLTLEPGSPLDEARLSRRFEMSRTPIREALVRLASEGLVTTLPNRNTIVSVIDFVRLPTYFDALALMYRVTTRDAAKNHRPEDLPAIRDHQKAFSDAVEIRDALAMIAANREFHIAIARAGGNTYYTEFFARLLDEGRRILRLYYSTFDDKLPLQYVDEHEEIINAIVRRDIDSCDRLATGHAEQIVRQIQSYIARSRSDPIRF